MSVSRTLSSLAAVLLLAAAAAAQGALDGQWLRLNVVAKGRVIDTATGDVTPATYKDTVYLFLTADGQLYDYTITYESAPGVWSTTGFSSFTPVGDGERIVASHDLTIPGEGSVSISGTITLELNIKLDGQGAFKGCNAKSLGGVLEGATLDGTDAFEGGLKAVGKVVPESKLPFQLG